jgi:uncharacterized membrane-anchored protein
MGTAVPFTDHPLRDRVVSEMHMRRMPPLVAPTLMIQIVRVVAPQDRTSEHQAVMHMPGVVDDARHVRPSHISGRRADGGHFLWERHSEASTATVILPRGSANPFQAGDADAAAMQWLGDIPGDVIRAVRVAIVEDEEKATALLDATGFSEAELVSCRIGPVRIWTDFLVRSDNFGRLILSAGGMAPADLGRLVQRIQELGNYRNLALLGLPTAQAEAPRIALLEQRLVDIVDIMAAGAVAPALLDQLCDLSAEVAAITAQTAFRMSATQAYAQIVLDRLDTLKADTIPGFQTLEEFTDRRFLPATRTCTSFVTRLDALSGRIERATSLLRTRVEMALQTQNGTLLQSMDRNAERQLRLQHVVEGLSVVAVSYYAVGLVSYLLKAASPYLHIQSEILIALSVAPVVLVVWLTLKRRIRHIVMKP